MKTSAPYLTPADAAKRLGVSAKALRLYEQRGLLAPHRTAAGWRVYGSNEMARAAEIVALRALGLGLTQVARVLKGDARDLEPALAAHQVRMESQARDLAGIIAKVRGVRADLAQGRMPAAAEVAELLGVPGGLSVAFDLPWPWGGERFELREIKALNYIVGPLGSGKTRLARRLAETLPNAAFLGLERLADPGAAARVEASLAWLVEEGARVSDALIALLIGVEAEGPACIIVDMVEDGLDRATQEAVITHLRRRGPDARPLFLMTRSCAILDLTEVGADETILLCPANHSPPIRVAPYPGAPGYEAVATCLASPEVRARTAGVVALRS